MKIGIFGGTFDPIHNGHISLAETARKTLALDEIMFIPAGLPWLKSGQNVTQAYHRIRMVKLAVNHRPYFSTSDIEVKREGPSYTADTLLEIHAARESGTQLYLITGMDAIMDMGRWHRPKRVLNLCTLVTVTRPGFPEFSSKVLEQIRAGVSKTIIQMDAPLIDISGTEIRTRLSQGMSISALVPQPVENYIYSKKLYV